MSGTLELRQDAEELRQLIEKATRQRVKDILTIELRKIETDITTREEQSKQESSEITTPPAQPVSKSKTGGQRLPTDIRTYAWDQSDKFMKIYATVHGVEKVPKENVTCEFREKGLHLQCRDVGDKDYQLVISNLMEEIISGESYYKVKTDTVLLMLKKKKAGKTWAYVTEREKKANDVKKKPDMDDSKDPSENLMGLLKQMYDDGDDEMKRTLAKAWAESRDKQAGGDASFM